jgi:hypothetical protein
VCVCVRARLDRNKGMADTSVDNMTKYLRMTETNQITSRGKLRVDYSRVRFGAVQFGFCDLSIYCLRT